MSIYKQSMLPELTWLCLIFTTILMTGELCLKSLITKTMVHCLGDDIKSVQTAACDLASFRTSEQLPLLAEGEYYRGCGCFGHLAQIGHVFS